MLPCLLKAHPTELTAAFAASHVHAAVVFLDGRFALRARLSVQSQPHLIKVHVLGLPEPSGVLVAGRGLVGFVVTFQAEVSAAFAAAGAVLTVTCRQLNQMAAVGYWTPLEQLVRLSVLLLVPFTILRCVWVVLLVFHELRKHTVRHYDVAASLLTPGLGAHCAN